MKTTNDITGIYRPKERRTALITGATSGIGKSFAYQLAQMGYDLILTGRKQNVLTSISEELETVYGVRVRQISADLSKLEDLKSIMELVDKQDRIDLLINNAGYGLNDLFHDDSLENQLKMMQVHVVAPVRLIHKVLPKMIRQKRGIVINVSSLAAFLPNSNNAMYTSTKSFLKNFSIALNMELNQYGIYIQCLCPGFTYSDFHKKLGINSQENGSRKLGWMTADDVVKYSLESVRHHRTLCIPGTLNKLVAFMALLLPSELINQVSKIVNPKPCHNTTVDTALEYAVGL